MPERRQFTPEEIELVARLQVPTSRRPHFRAGEAAVFGVLVTADIGTWLLVALRGLHELLPGA